MREPDRIADLIDRAHDGDAWHGPSVMAALEGVTPALAAARPVPGAHAIWELVLHITAWRREVTRRLGGAPAGEPDAGDWPPVREPSDEAWRRAVADLRESRDALVHAVRALDPARLDAPVPDTRDPALGTGVSLYVTLHGIVQHDLYHAGQIVLLKKAAAGR